MDKITKKYLIYLCIVIIIIIILRFLYIGLNKIEGFAINTGDAVDLLSKQTTHLMIVKNSNSFNQISSIKPWTTKIYNIQSLVRQTKDIAIYQPNLFINKQQYCKLGDTLSTNANYVLPNANQLTLLIKKNGSDIKPPVDYTLIVNFGDEYVNSKYYEYESYIDDINKINLITPNLIFCLNVFKTMNDLITSSDSTLNSNLYLKIINESTMNVIVDNIIIPIKNIINLKNAGITGKMTIKINSAANSNCPGSSLGNPSDPNTCNGGNSYISTINVPIGVSGHFNIGEPVRDFVYLRFDFPDNLNSLQNNDETQISNSIPQKEYGVIGSIKSNNISINTYIYNIFELIPIMSIINFLSTVCNNINTIYNNEKTNTTFLTYLNLISDNNIILTILTKIDLLKNFISSFNNVNIISIFSNPEITSYYTDLLNTISSNETTMVGLIFTIIRSMKITYNLPFITFSSSTKNYSVPEPEKFSDVFENQRHNNNNNNIEHFHSFMDDRNTDINIVKVSNAANAKKNQIDSITFTTFTNDFLENIPSNNYEVNLIYNTVINSTLFNLLNFINFKANLTTNSQLNLPLKIYKPIAPPGYISLGHVFCNLQSQLLDIKNNDSTGIGTCCIPENCVKEIREWNASDKVFEYNHSNKYWALYFNPYIGTFISVNTNKLPEGKLCKVVACVKKCTAVDDLKKADECARNYYNLNKNSKHDVISGADLVSDQEEVFYLEKLKAQSDSITRLSSKAQQMQLAIDKATIVNSEMNKNKLQNYVDKQKINIDLILQRLIKDKNSIETNIHIPLNVLNTLLNMIKNHNTMSEEDKKKLIAKLIKNKQVSCPEYDLTGLVKKQLVSDVCYGCDAP